ncbi:hypothetical protein KIM372_01870 [Bombiscardovia nodaiensis]|uniref:InlB B-repeat-containing protein n=1 Tax=Bombiscardovia nodaiensis TaxID=2932181 RepID=A0ABN6SBT8_9BIFI|nr:hypothetical protein KIM372_01870 [Bombiscardovia nodaiensis]
MVHANRTKYLRWVPRILTIVVVSVVLVVFAAAGVQALAGPGTANSDTAKAAAKSVAGKSAESAQNGSQPSEQTPPAPHLPIKRDGSFYGTFTDPKMAEAVARGFGASPYDAFTASMYQSTYVTIRGDGITNISGIEWFSYASTIIFEGDNNFRGYDLHILQGMYSLNEFGLNGGTHYTSDMIPYIKQYIPNLKKLDLERDGYGPDGSGLLTTLYSTFLGVSIDLDLSGNHLTSLSGLRGMPGLRNLDASGQVMNWPDLEQGGSVKPTSPYTLGGATSYNPNGRMTSYSASPSGGTFEPIQCAWTWPTTEKGVHSFSFSESGTYNGTSYTYSGTFSQDIKQPGVTFYGNGGTPTVITGWEPPGTTIYPPTVSWDHHRFTGWYTAAVGGSQLYFPTVINDKNITAWAHWEETPKVTVTFDSQGGSAVPAAQVYPGDRVAQPADPTKGVSIFRGWYTAPSGGSKWVFTTAVNANMTLYAQWTDPVVVTFNPNGGTGTPSPQSIMPGGRVGTPDATPSKGDSRFDGWFTAATGGRQWVFASDTVTTNMTLYAHWTDRLEVTFDTRGGSLVASQRVLPGELAIRPGTDPTKGDSRFDGWFTTASGNTPWAFATTPVNSNVTIYAHWTDQYTVKFDLNGGQGTIPDQRLYSGSKVTRPVNPTSGQMYVYFDGWYTASSGGRLWDFGTDTVTSDVTIYAHWYQTYWVGFHVGQYVSDGDSTEWVREGRTVPRPADPTRPDAAFVGWYTAYTGGDEWNFNTPINQNWNLYAHWKSYNVTFNPQNGETPTVKPVKPDVAMAEPTPRPTNPGKVFAGWYLAASGGNKWDFTNPVSGDMTLYAHWEDFRPLPAAGAKPVVRATGLVLGALTPVSALLGVAFIYHQRRASRSDKN